MIVVGAGAAGVAAALRLSGAGLSVVVLEAGARVGGRAHTVVREGMALDLGCGWLHSGERNPWTFEAERLGLTVDLSKARWDVQWLGLGFPEAEQQAFGAAFEAFDAEVERLAAGPDVALSEALPVAGEWAGAVDAVVGYLDGACASQVSLIDHHAFDAAASDNNWRVREGYGTAVARAAEGLDIRLGAVVEAVVVTPAGVRVSGSFGTIEAARVIVTVSTGVLGAIRFDPLLPGKVTDAGKLPMGHVGKLYLAVEGADDLPVNGHLRGRPRDTCSASHRLRPFGWPVVECYFGGPYAEALARLGEAGTADAMIGELAGLLGNDWRHRLRPIAASAWHSEPHIGGAWSYARPGEHDARLRLAEPVGDRIFFAGEACEPVDIGTAHGAHATGVRAADAVVRSLGRLTPGPRAAL
ncbi:flavin monoamine oxidase family protein [Glacieibacterium sp.]|uniref:flavin monoamine oxidase family protein n=1 Tax=Glacieibacterium sp. TaxID=2860237 RepID=UPI003AFFDFE6